MLDACRTQDRTNLQWPGLYALFWMLVWTPRARSGRIVAATVTIAVATSSILALVFLRLAIARVAWTRGAGRRDRHALVLAGLLTAGVGLQVTGILFGSSERGFAPDPVLAVTGFVVRAVPSTFVGDVRLHATVNAGWLALAALGWIMVAAVVVSGLGRRDGRPNWVLAGVASAHAAAVYAVPVLLSGFAPQRYALLATALWVFAAAFALVCTLNLRVDNARADGPELERGAAERPAAVRRELRALGANPHRAGVGLRLDRHPSVRLRAPLAARPSPVCCVPPRSASDEPTVGPGFAAIRWECP